MSTTIEIVGDPVAAPLPHDPASRRAIVRITDIPDAAHAALGYRPRVTFGIARDQGVDRAWAIRVDCRTLKGARETFARRAYP